MSVYSVIELKNFRSYEEYSLELSPGINIVVGPNASGKTNLLESIYVVSQGKSFRATDKDLVRFDESWYRVDGHWGDRVRSVRFSADENGTKKELHIDEDVHKRMSRKTRIPTTLFDPEHMRLIVGSPDLRRQFMDNILEQIDDNYGSNLRNYKRALAQRNRLLKSFNPSVDHLFVWDLKLAEHGTYVYQNRQRLIENLNAESSDIYSQIADKKSEVVFTYAATTPQAADYQSALLRELHDKHEADTQRGFTSVGPHRDDMEVLLNGHQAQVAASRGETRTAVLMAKIMELKLLENHTGMRPILLLDDVFSELDGSRRRAMTSFLKPYQTLITTTDADAVVKSFLDDYNIIPTGGNTEES